jgi:hypothetical protein
MLQAARAQIRCRQIEVSDLDSIASLLAGGFPGSTKGFWSGALERLQNRRVPDGFPRFGYMLESEGAAVGVLMLICSEAGCGSPASIRCNVSSWYVEPAFRNLAPLLVSRAMKHKPATFINVSPAPHTWPIIEAQGFSRFCTGTFVAIPALIPRFGTARIREFRRATDFSKSLAADDIALLSDHRDYGCLCLVCETKDGAFPMIFRRKNIWRGLLPAAQLIYCPSLDSLTKAAGPLGRYLLGKGLPLLLIGATGPLPLPGRYSHDKWPMYYRGQDKPWSGDIAYTERAIFGV